MKTLIIGFIMVIASLFLLYYILNSKKKHELLIILMWALCYWGLWFALKYAYLKTLTASEYSIKTEVRQRVVNGTITKSDTVYIFTPKEREKK